MPAHRTTDGNLDHAPIYIRAAVGLDLGWKQQAKCLGKGVELGGIWLLDDNEEVWFGDSMYSGEVLTEMALTWCSVCPVQYDCTRFGVITRAKVGTYGVHHNLLVKLMKREDWLEIIEDAELSDTPVQVMVSARLEPPTC
jgi:hypothetical protein